MRRPSPDRRVLGTLLLALAVSTGCETDNNGDDDYYRDRDVQDRDYRDRERDDRLDNGAANPGVNEEPFNARNVQPDTRILSILHHKNQEEVRLGRLAIRRGDSAAVKRYAEMLVRDHTNNDRELRSAADQTGINLLDSSRVQEILDQENRRTEPGAPSRPERDTDERDTDADPLSQLEILEGPDFDRRFIELMSTGHQELINMVEDAQRMVTREEVRSYLARTLPRLRHHAAEAQALIADPLDQNPEGAGNLRDRPYPGG